MVLEQHGTMDRRKSHQLYFAKKVIISRLVSPSPNTMATMVRFLTFRRLKAAERISASMQAAPNARLYSVVDNPNLSW